MLKSKLKTLITIGLISLFFLISFRAFALYRVPIFNSDNAVHILMAQDLNLPEDLYYWGQNRLGSLLPILSYCGVRIFSLSPIVAVSYVHYLLLLIGFLSFSSILSSNFSKLTLALVWFLPAVTFTSTIEAVQPYTPQFATIGCALAFINQLNIYKNSIFWQRGLLIIGSLISLCLSLWISEQSIIIVLIVGYLIRRKCIVLNSLEKKSKYLNRSENRSGNKFKKLNSINVRANLVQHLSYSKIFNFTTLIGVAFIVTAKVSAAPSYGIFKINSLATTWVVFRSVMKLIIQSITFSIDNWLLSFYSIACLGLASFLIAISMIWIQKKWTKNFKFRTAIHRAFDSDLKWSVLFGVNTIGSFLLLIISEWVYRNEINIRYFSVVYLSLWLAIIFYSDAIRNVSFESSKIEIFSSFKRYLFKINTPLLVLLLLVALSGSLSLPSYVYSLSPTKSQLSKLTGFNQLGEAGIIGDYWNSYIICSVNPEKLHCTPHDRSMVRSIRSAKKVMASAKIYLVKERWLDHFPDQIVQFETRLIKQGPEIKIDQYTLALYKRE
jgi:hypothetical protein